MSTPTSPCLARDPRRRLSVGAVLLILTAGARPADAGQLTVEGYVAARGTGVSSQPSWREGAFGRVTLGADSASDEEIYGVGKLHLTLDWQPSPFFGAFVHVVGRAEPSDTGGDEIGVIEAFLHASAPAGSSGAFSFQLGHFFLPTSRENVELAWSSPYTLTYSAINTWIGEEMRLTGLLAEYEVDVSDRARLRFGASAFGGNDSNGALLAWRGWAFGDRLSAFGELVPLPPLASLAPGGVFYHQRDDGTKPFGEDLDDRAGWAAFARWQYADRATLQLTRYDNRGDRGLYRGEYAWRTELDLLGVELRPHDALTLAGEYMEGSTGMGFGSPYDYVQSKVQADFEAAYLLASWQRGAFRATLRYDSFETVDVDVNGPDDNNDDGDAWTFAVFFDARDDLRLGLELSSVDAERPAAARNGFEADTGADSVKLELRYYFGSP